jgi:hypothetical protein
MYLDGSDDPQNPSILIEKTRYHRSKLENNGGQNNRPSVQANGPVHCVIA